MSLLNGVAVSVKDVLKAKDERTSYQQYLAIHDQATIVAFKLNIPGAIKNNKMITNIFNEGMLAWNQCVAENRFKILTCTSDYKKTGPEYFASLSQQPLLVKAITTKIEEEHPLGRLFDFDVLDKNLQQYGRSQIKKAARKCLICDADAFVCSRSQAHDLDCLLSNIINLATDYFSSK